MAIRGSLGEATLADVLQLLALGRKTGCLAVFGEQRFGRIFLREGRVTHASIVNRRDRLGDLLVRNGVVSSADLAAAIERQTGRNSQRIGEILVAAGALSRQQLEHYIAIQIEEAIYFLFTWDSGSFHFESDLLPDERELLVSLNPEQLLLEGARRVDEWSLIEKRVPGPEAIFAAGPADPAEGGANLTPEQHRVLDLLDAERTVREVIDRSGLLEFEGTRAIFEVAQAGLAHYVGRRAAGAVEQGLDARATEHENLAAAFYETGMLEEAEREYRTVQEIAPGRWEARFRLAAIEMRGGRYRHAARRLMALIGEGRHTPAVFHNLALTLEAMGRLPHALLTADEGLRHFPASAPLLLSRAIVLTKLRRAAAASRAFDRYVQADSRASVLPAAFYHFSCLAHAAAGGVAEAVRLADEGTGYFPHHAPLLAHAALVHEVAGDPQRAEELYRRAFAADALLPQSRRGLARVLHRAGRLEEAAGHYRALLSDHPDAELRFLLGSIAYQRGDRADAIAQWKAALQADPSYEPARTRLRLVEPALRSVAG